MASNIEKQSAIKLLPTFSPLRNSKICQGSVLGFEVEAFGGSYISQLGKVEDTTELDGLIKDDKGGFLNPNIFRLKIPEVVTPFYLQSTGTRQASQWFSCKIVARRY